MTFHKTITPGRKLRMEYEQGIVKRHEEVGMHGARERGSEAYRG